MKQLSFFNDESPFAQSNVQSSFWKLYVDGAARNNPGPSGAGIYIQKNEKLVEKSGIFLGLKTNNQAEYFALLFGLYRIGKLSAQQDLLLVISDSQLLIRQLQGLYKVKEPHLKPLFTLAQSQLQQINHTLTHVLREENGEADEQANHAIDHKIQAPSDFLELLQHHAISL